MKHTNRTSIIFMLLVFAFTGLTATAQTNDKAQTCRATYEQMRRYAESRPDMAAAFGKVFLNQSCGEAFPTLIEPVKNYLAAVEQQTRQTATTQPAKPASREEDINLNRLPANGLTEAWIKKYIQREEDAFVAGARPAVTVTLAFETIQIGKPRPYRGNPIFGLADGETVHPVRAKYTRTKSSSLRTETVTQTWDYLFYKDVDGKLKHSAKLVEPVK